MRDIRVATAQFENRDNDKEYNLSRIRELTRRAALQGAEIVSFHEGCIPGYTWIQPLTKAQLLNAAEPVPDGSSLKKLIEIAAEFQIVVMAGLIERDAEDNVVCTDSRVIRFGTSMGARYIDYRISIHATHGDITFADT
ncbi:MAG: nitrilase, partial [Planctomycetes bacterium]|nr:nitrilase [Planctomycetota bacterium]